MNGQSAVQGTIMDFREKCLGCIHASFTARYAQPGQWARSIGGGVSRMAEQIVVWASTMPWLETTKFTLACLLRV